MRCYLQRGVHTAYDINVGFTKLFTDIVCSSIWNEDDKTRLVWITLLAIKGANHIARATIGGLAHQARVSVPDCQRAIEKLSSPDPDGLDQEYEGRRIKAVEHGWLILNGEKYKQRRDEDDRREYQKLYHREYRRKQSVNKRKPPSISSIGINLSDQIRSDTDHNTQSLTEIGVQGEGAKAPEQESEAFALRSEQPKKEERKPASKEELLDLAAKNNVLASWAMTFFRHFNETDWTRLEGSKRVPIKSWKRTFMKYWSCGYLNKEQHLRDADRDNQKPKTWQQR